MVLSPCFFANFVITGNILHETRKKCLHNLFFCDSNLLYCFTANAYFPQGNFLPGKIGGKTESTIPTKKRAKKPNSPLALSCCQIQGIFAPPRTDLNFLESLVPSGNVELLVLMGLSERLAPLLLTSSAVQSNPRLIKRFLNTVFLRKALAAPQGIDVDVPVLAKWHLLERCDESLANAISEAVSAQSDGRVAMLRGAEEEAKNPETKLTAPFGEKPFAREWLQLEPALADFDMRPLLHLSRDSTVRDYGADDLSAEGKVLRDNLASARAQNEALKEKIRTVGEVQAALAMTHAWEQRRASRTWQKAKDVLMLTEVCSIFPSAGARAAALLAHAPVVQLSPGLAHALVTCSWAQESDIKKGCIWHFPLILLARLCQVSDRSSPVPQVEWQIFRPRTVGRICDETNSRGT